MIGMMIKVEASKKIDDGVHKGTIKDVDYRTEPFNYTDIEIELDDKVTIRASYPTMICPSSKLGRLLIRFGVKLEVGQELDIETILIGKRCVFQSTSEEKDGVRYSKVLTESLQPQ
jgi:hypothetical protein